MIFLECAEHVYKEYQLSRKRLLMPSVPDWKDLSIDVMTLWSSVVLHVRAFEQEHQRSFDEADAKVLELAAAIAVDMKESEKRELYGCPCGTPGCPTGPECFGGSDY